jgi:NitT/TauT family transport system ATP-binding protein
VALTSSPTSVRSVIDVDLPRPRDQVVTKETPEFAHLRAQVFRLIKHNEAAPMQYGDPTTLRER